jgi:hypothetical protein
MAPLLFQPGGAVDHWDGSVFAGNQTPIARSSSPELSHYTDWATRADLLTRDKGCHSVRCNPAGRASRHPTSTWGAGRLLRNSCCLLPLLPGSPFRRGANAVPSATRTRNAVGATRLCDVVLYGGFTLDTRGPSQVSPCEICLVPLPLPGQGFLRELWFSRVNTVTVPHAFIHSFFHSFIQHRCMIFQLTASLNNTQCFWTSEPVCPSAVLDSWF